MASDGFGSEFREPEEEADSRLSLQRQEEAIKSSSNGDDRLHRWPPPQFVNNLFALIGFLLGYLRTSPLIWPLDQEKSHKYKCWFLIESRWIATNL